jgi:hypothetical protein
METLDLVALILDGVLEVAAWYFILLDCRMRWFLKL